MANEAADKQAILETILKFSWAIDTAKPLSAYSPHPFEAVFTEDFQFGLSREQVANTDDIKLNPMGRAGFAAFVEGVQGKYLATQHHCTNTLITFTDVDCADAKTYATNYHKKKDGSHYDYFGVYDDKLVRTPQGWRIVARKQYPFFTEDRSWYS